MGFDFLTTQVPGYPIGLVSQSKYCDMCNWSNNCLGVHYARLWHNRVPHFQGTVGVRYAHTQQKLSYNVYIYCYMLFSRISLGETIWRMKPMPVIFLFSDSCESLSITWSFYWNPCMLRKLYNDVKAYIISISPPVIH